MGGKDHKALIFFCCIILFLSACKKDKPGYVPHIPSASSSGNVYVVCEGSLGNGNSTLSLYRPATDSTYEDLYKAVNTQSLGDVFQSMTRIGDNLFLCINNSDKLVVVNRNTWRFVATISIPKPRYVLQLSDTKAYVSTIFSNKVYIINPQTFAVTGQIDMPAQNPEQMLHYNNKVYICNWDSTFNKLCVLDDNTDQLITQIDLPGYAPKELTIDKNSKLWLLSGNIQANKSAYFSKVDPAIDNVIASYPFPATADPIKPVFNNTADTLYFIEVNYNGTASYNGVYRMPITATAVPAQPFVPAQLYQYFYAVGIEPGTGNIYMGDPIGFTQKGIVYVYNPAGTLLKQFNVGVGPGHFFFD